jgi:hypothetical protein
MGHKRPRFIRTIRSQTQSQINQSNILTHSAKLHILKWSIIKSNQNNTGGKKNIWKKEQINWFNTSRKKKGI